MYIFTSLYIHLKLKHFKCCILGLDIWFSTWRQNDRTSEFYLFFSSVFFSFVLQELCYTNCKMKVELHPIKNSPVLFIFFFFFFTFIPMIPKIILQYLKNKTRNNLSAYSSSCPTLLLLLSFIIKHVCSDEETGRRHGDLHFREWEDGRWGHSAELLA